MKTRLFLLFLICHTAIVLDAAPAKYIFYLIGDGMGQNQVNTTEMYLAELQGRIGREPLLMTQFPYSGTVTTYSQSNSITCSSAAGTALSSGEKTKNGTLGLRADGSPMRSIAEVLRDEGWGIGIMTSVSIDHATPAAFYAHVNKRKEYYKIGTQLARSGFDFFGGGTFYHPVAREDKGEKDEGNVYQLCRDNGYTFARGYEEYQNKKDSASKMILIQAHEGMTDDYKGKGMLPYRIDRKNGDLSLPQITEAAIDFLSAHHDKFFMMVEGGAIDWACHSNDAATVIKEVIEFDEALRVVYEFYLQHQDETLIVVTADHETGGLSMANSDYTLNLKILRNQKLSVDKLSDRLHELHKQAGRKMSWVMVKDVLRTELGFYDTVDITPEEDAQLQAQFKTMKRGKAKDVRTLYKQLSALSFAAVRLLDTKAHLAWGTTGHSASGVAVFAIGAGAEQFTGWIDNTSIKGKMLNAAHQ